jgi:uncharacterized protein with FMN-binding domain
LPNSNSQLIAITSKKSKGVVQALALVAVSISGAFLLQVPHANASSNSVAQNSGPKTATGDAVDYEFGTIQLSVTTDGSKLTDVGLIQAGANGGREQAFSYLVSDAITANGSNFANLSGATYTTDAFKRALDSAISKLN